MNLAAFADIENYTHWWKVGDVFSVILDIDNLTLRYLRNGVDLGVAFDESVLGEGATDFRFRFGVAALANYNTNGLQLKLLGSEGTPFFVEAFFSRY